MQSWIYWYNGKRRLVQGLNRQDADTKFQERYGFWPSEELVDIEISTVRPVP